LIDAAFEEILDKSIEEQIENDPAGKVTRLLALNALRQGNLEGAITIIQRRLYVQPDNVQFRNQLAKLGAQTGSGITSAALVSIEKSSRTSASSEILRVTTSVKTGDLPGSFKVAQKAVMQEPWVRDCWISLAYTSIFRN